MGSKTWLQCQRLLADLCLAWIGDSTAGFLQMSSLESEALKLELTQAEPPRPCRPQVPNPDHKRFLAVEFGSFLALLGHPWAPAQADFQHEPSLDRYLSNAS